ncbi:MAG: monoamine oxidase [Candidatus Dependentiae bacterium]|nr:monoamine oxidase [Candidatus Dependentiae bacterium]
MTMTSLSPSTPTVAVIGAGLAGLTTAYRLQQKGIDVQVYEARNHVGGRVLTALINGTVVELGGQNITDGGEASTMRTLIKEMGLTTTESQNLMRCAYYDGTTITPDFELTASLSLAPEELHTKLVDLAAQSGTMEEVLDGILERGSPLYTMIATRLAAYEGAPVDQLSSHYSGTLYAMLTGGVARAHPGKPESQKSYFHRASVAGGNAQLPEALARRLGVHLHLNHQLTDVTRNADASYQLTFANRVVARADRIVFAIPCSVYNDITFDDGVIPAPQLAAMREVPYGTNAKIFVPGIIASEDTRALTNDHATSWFNDNQLIIYYTGASSFFTPDTIGNSYLQERPMLGLEYGQQCPPFQTPAYAQDTQFCSYTGPVGYSWPNDPYVKGSYSYIAPGKEEGMLSKSIFATVDNRIYFAGEHASILSNVPGTMEAACESGERVARIILESLS